MNARNNDFGLVRNFGENENDEVVFMNYDEIRDYTIKKLDSFITDLAAISITHPKTLLEFIKNVVIVIQEVDDDFAELSGEKKNALATDIITWVIYDKFNLDFDIPYVPGFMEKKVFKSVLSQALIPFITDWFKHKN